MSYYDRLRWIVMSLMTAVGGGSGTGNVATLGTRPRNGSKRSATVPRK